MQIRTFHAESVKAFRQQYALQTYDGFGPVAAIVFTSVELDLDDLTAFLQGERLRVFGSTSCGEFLYDKGGKRISEGAAVCLLMDLEPETFDIAQFNGDGISSYDLGTAIGKWTAGIFKNPALLLLASGMETDGERLVRGIQHETGDGITMFGGLAGDDARFKDTAVFSESKAEHNGAMAMVFDLDRYDITGIAASGWVGIGADKIVTKSEGNIVYTIDHEPALEVYKNYLNVRDEDLPGIGIEYPLLIKKEGREDVLRAVINVDPARKALLFAGSVPQGAVVTFSSSPGFEIVEFTKDKIREFHERNNNTQVLILFSCMARHLALGPTIADEIEEAWQKWKTPLIGFFTYGEIGNNYKSDCDFYNQTYTLVSIKQK
jgi:hypothetical protein